MQYQAIVVYIICMMFYAEQKFNRQMTIMSCFIFVIAYAGISRVLGWTAWPFELAASILSMIVCFTDVCTLYDYAKDPQEGLGVNLR